MFFSELVLLILGILFPLSAFSLADVQAAPNNEKVKVFIGFTKTPGASEQALVRAFDGDILHSYHNIIPAIEWAAGNGIKITNNSYGSTGYPGTLVEQAFSNTNNSGMLHIAAAGNEGNPAGRGDNVIYPARFTSVVAVAASDINNKRASFSSTGSAVELIAPGVSIRSTLKDGGYGLMSGTSMVSPHVAGVAALVWVADSSRTNEQVRAVLRDNAQDLNLPANHQGKGLVRADLAVAEVVETAQPLKYTLTIETRPSEGGSAMDNTNTGPYEAGAKVNVSASANTGYEFVNWTVGAEVVSENTTFDYTMPAANTTLTANFNELAGPPIEGTVTVQPIVYSGSGGRDNNKHLHVTISLKDDLGNWVSGASVSITLERNELPYATVTGSTNSNGSVTFSFNNAPSGTYSTLINDVSAMGLTWDELQPDDPKVTR